MELVFNLSILRIHMNSCEAFDGWLSLGQINMLVCRESLTLSFRTLGGSDAEPRGSMWYLDKDPRTLARHTFHTHVPA
jgi:hypothetical protein